MNQIIKPESVDFNELVSNNTNKISINYQSKMIDVLNREFTEEQARWYIASLFMFINYHPTNEFPINLEILVELAGFSHKRNAKRTLENNFILDVDYKILVLPKEQQVKTNGGAGLNKDKIMLNTDTFKSMCMLVKTKKSKDIRLYYVKLENIYNKIVMEEMETTQKLLKEKNELLIEQKQVNVVQRDKITRIERKKLEKYQKGENVYIGTDKEDRSVIGITKDINERRCHYKTHNPDFEIKYIIPCKDYSLTEKIIKNIMKKYTIGTSTEWFNCHYEQLKTIVEVVVYIMDDTTHDYDIFDDVYRQFSNIHSTIFTKNNEIKIDIKKEIILNNAIESIKVKKSEELFNNYFTQDLYRQFLTENCEIDDSYKESGKTLLLEFKSYLQNTELKCKINELHHETGYTNSFGFNQKFKKEFYDNLEIILTTNLTDFRVNNKIISGFRTVRIKNNRPIVIKQNDPMYFTNENYNKFFSEHITYIPGKERSKNIPKIKTSDIILHFTKYVIENNIEIIDYNYKKDKREYLANNQEFTRCFVLLISNKYNIQQHKRLSFETGGNRHYGFYGIQLK